MNLPTPPPRDIIDTGEGLVDVLALHAEDVTLGRRQVDGDTVRIATVTQSREQLVEAELNHERVDVERVAIGRIVDVVPPIRQEGDITILSVVEEIVVVERRLLLKEEVRVRRVAVTGIHRETVSLREQTVEVTRSSPDR